MDIRTFSILLGILLGIVNALLGWMLIRRSLQQRHTIKWLQVLLGSMAVRMLLVLGAFILAIFLLPVEKMTFAISFLLAVFVGLALDAYWITKKVKS